MLLRLTSRSSSKCFETAGPVIPRVVATPPSYPAPASAFSSVGDAKASGKDSYPAVAVVCWVVRLRALASSRNEVLGG
jgi:hypothetical protein